VPKPLGNAISLTALTGDSQMIVANNLSDALTIFDIDERGELRASDQVTVRRPAFIAPFGAGGPATVARNHSASSRRSPVQP
jgi:hypothetical protein